MYWNHDERDASSIYAFWHSDTNRTITVCLEAADRPNEFFVKIHTDPDPRLRRPVKGSYLTVLPPTSYEVDQGTHFCCFTTPEKLPLFNVGSQSDLVALCLQ